MQWQKLGLLMAGMAFFAQLCDAQGVYKCKSKDGATSYADAPCHGGAQTQTRHVKPEDRPKVVTPAEAAKDFERQLKPAMLAKAAADADSAKRAAAQEKTERKNAAGRLVLEQPFDFDSCLTAINRAVLQLQIVGGAERMQRVMTTDQAAIRRLCTDDAKLVITCSALDRRLTVHQWARRPNDGCL